MLRLIDQRKLLAWSDLIPRCMVSCIVVLLTQFGLSLVPLFFSAASVFLQVPLSALVLLVVLGSGRFCRRVIGVHASAPAFVFFSILFIWVVYITVVRRAISHFMDIVFNLEVVILLIGLRSILSSDPGLVTDGFPDLDQHLETSVLEVESDDESSLLKRRIRYCKSCKAYIKGFDHHCPAFGNCIGQDNYVLFVVLLAGFLTTEASYVVCSFQFARDLGILDRTRSKISLGEVLVNSTAVFSLLQMLWQVVFLTWHIYCICFNIRTDEWINWTKYPEFQIASQSPGEEGFTRLEFKNPYDKGILPNLKEFLQVKI